MESPVKITDLHIITHVGAESLCSATHATRCGRQPVLIRYYGDQFRPAGDMVRNEFEITRRLSMSGVLKPTAIFDSENPPFLLFDYLDVALLRPTFGRPWDVSAVLHLARQLLVLVGRLHTLGILHLAINPFNLLMGCADEAPPTVLLSGFGHAARASDFQRQPGYRELPPEFLPYVSPEQTGRTGFSHDERSDYYSIGAVLYELVSGRAPVPKGEVEGMVYAILAKPPVDLEIMQKDIPPALSTIIMRLLAKDPADRYQSAGQILRDLHACGGRGAAHRLSALPRGYSPHGTGPLGKFASTCLVGRERERRQVEDALIRARKGEQSVLAGSGFAGSGKTTLIREVLFPESGSGDILLLGKFELNSSAPYGAFVQACGSHIRKMLAQPEPNASQWRQATSAFLQGQGLGLLGVFSELDALAERPSEGDGGNEAFPPLERKRRLQRSAVSLFRFWTGTGSTIVLFLDDLQWADPASLELCLCLIEAAIPRLLTAVAYRANELPPSHPTRLLVDEIETVAGERGRVRLGPLTESEVMELVKELAPGLPPSQREALARHVEVRTGGNPHFICEQVRRLRERRSLYFDFLRTRWRYEALADDSKEGSPDITLFLADAMRELPGEEQSVLSIASFFSHGAPLESLSTLTGIAPERTAALLQRLCRRHFMTVRYSENQGVQVELFRFTHDNIRQAASLLIPSSDQPALHLRLGKVLRASCGAGHTEEDLYETVEHLNAAAALLTDPAERYETARLDLEAGVKAKRSGAFASSARYLRAGVSLLPANGWATEYALTLSLHDEAAEALFLVGDYECMNHLVDTVIKEARCFLDSVRAIEVRIQWLVAANRLQDASRLSIETARRLGLRHLAAKNKAVAMFRRFRARALARGLDIEKLAARQMQNPRDLAACRILLRGYTPTITSMPKAVLSLATEMALLTLVRGISPYAPTALAALGMVLVAERRVAEGYRLGELALRLQERINSPVTRATVQTIVYFFIFPWVVHWHHMLTLFAEAMETGERTGEYEHAALAGHFLSNFAVFSGIEIGQADLEISRITTIIDRMRQQRSSIGVRRHRQFALNLITSPEGFPPYVLAGPAFDEAPMMPVLEAAGDSSAIAMIMIYKTIIACLFDDEEHALEFAEKAAAAIPAVPAQPTVHWTVFYHSLSLLAACGKNSRPWKRAALKKVREYLQLLKRWASSSPINFRHRYDLVHAEYLAAGGDTRAEEGFLQAVQSAARSGYIQDEALAQRRTAYFYDAIGRQKECRNHLREAYRLYAKWGATAVVGHLEHRFPWLIDRQGSTPAEYDSSPVVAPTDLDFETLMNAGRLISSQIEIDSLIEQIIRIIMQCAGATHGILEVEEDGSLVALLEGHAEQKGISVITHDCSTAPRLDRPIVRHVRETGEASVEAAGPEAVPVSRSSVLCAPLLHRGRLIGLIYLENTLAANVFTTERLRVVELLAAQAAVSLENAAVYRLHETVAEQREKLQAAEKLATLGALTASVAHEVSNPAHVIRLNASSISEALRNLDTAIEDGTVVRDAPHVQARIHGAVQEVTAAVDRIESIVGDMKQYAGGGQGEGCHEADLNAVVQSVLRLSGPLIRRCTHCAETTLTPDLPPVKGEFGRLQQVVLNLVENACQAISDPSQAVKIQTAVAQGSAWVELTVADEGRGIHPQLMARVTDPLFTTRRSEGGTGLGLAIVSGIVKEYGGVLSIESTEGKGTRVRVRFLQAHRLTGSASWTQTP